MNATQLRYPLWQGPLLQAVMETKADKLRERIQVAENAVSPRLRELEGNPASREERDALHDAVSTLRILKGELTQSGWPDN